MKYLSVIVFAVLMTWTWIMINSEPPVSLETHAGIQSKLGALIEETIRSKKPSVSEVNIDQIWTESVDNTQGKKIKAHFSYRFKESTEAGNTESLIKGEGLLERQATDESGVEKWSLSEVKTTGDSVIFQEAMTITTGDSSAEQAPGNDATTPTKPVSGH